MNVWDTLYKLLTYEKECVGHSVYVAYLPKGMCGTLCISCLRTKRNVWDTLYKLLTYEKECVGHSGYVM